MSKPQEARVQTIRPPKAWPKTKTGENYTVTIDQSVAEEVLDGIAALEESAQSQPYPVPPKTTHQPVVDDISLPTHIRVEKDGKDTRVHCAVSGAEVLGISTVKLDLSDGKTGKAKLTFECDVAEVVIVDKQLSFLK